MTFMYDIYVTYIPRERKGRTSLRVDWIDVFDHDGTIDLAHHERQKNLALPNVSPVLVSSWP